MDLGAAEGHARQGGRRQSAPVHLHPGEVHVLDMRAREIQIPQDNPGGTRLEETPHMGRGRGVVHDACSCT
jgi:hypothetical protein